MAGGDLLQEYAFPYELQDIHRESLNELPPGCGEMKYKNRSW